MVLTHCNLCITVRCCCRARRRKCATRTTTFSDRSTPASANAHSRDPPLCASLSKLCSLSSAQLEGHVDTIFYNPQQVAAAPSVDAVVRQLATPAGDAISTLMAVDRDMVNATRPLINQSPILALAPLHR